MRPGGMFPMTGGGRPRLGGCCMRCCCMRFGCPGPGGGPLPAQPGGGALKSTPCPPPLPGAPPPCPPAPPGGPPLKLIINRLLY